MVNLALAGVARLEYHPVAGLFPQLGCVQEATN